MADPSVIANLEISRKVVPPGRPFYFVLLIVISIGCSAPKKYTYFFDHHQTPTYQNDSLQSGAEVTGIDPEEATPVLYASSAPMIVSEKKQPATITLRSIKKIITQTSDSIPSNKPASKAHKKRGFAFAGLATAVLGIIITVIGSPYATGASMAGIVFSAISIILSAIGLKSDRRTIATIGLALGTGGLILFLVLFVRSIPDFSGLTVF